MFYPSRSGVWFYAASQNYPSITRDVALGRIQRGDDVATAEGRLAEFVGVDHAICMPKARVGIYLALSSLIKEGQKVILSAYNLYDVVNMVVCAGGVPVFADVERATCNIDPGEIERLVDEDTGAVLITHLHGLACDVRRISAICRDRGVPLIEDAAQAFGARVDGQALGTFGAVGVYSFGSAKNVNSLFGGAVVTRDRQLHERIGEELARYRYQETSVLLKRALHCLAFDILTLPVIFRLLTFWIFRYGRLHDVEAINKTVRTQDNPRLTEVIPESYLRRMTPMQARLVDAQLNHVDEHAKTRIAHARLYDEGLSGIADLILPPLRDDGSHVYWYYPIQAPDRLDLLKFMMKRGRHVVAQQLPNVADLECFEEYARDCPNTRVTADSVLLLPTYPYYDAREIEKNITAMRQYFGVG